MKVKAIRLLLGTVADDETNTRGRYSLRWQGGTGAHRLKADLEGQFVRSVTDKDNTDLYYQGPIFTSTSGTQNWTWDDASKYADQLNLFYHTNKVARWFDGRLKDITHKVRLVANTNTSIYPAWTRRGTYLEFSDDLDGEHQADLIYHEYTHSVVYHLHGRTIGDDLQARALSEGMAFYFSASFLNDKEVWSLRSEPTTRTNLYNSKVVADTTTDAHDNGEITGGAAWDLRRNLGATKADEIIFTALEMSSPRANDFQKFTDNVFMADDALYGNSNWNWEGCGDSDNDTSPNAGKIWDAFVDQHEMPTTLLNEDPDCPSSKPVADAAPVAPVLEGAYPNPFNPSVSLRYQVDQPGKVDVGVYSLTGQLVRHLSAENAAVPGSYSVAWDGLLDSGVAASSGMYFIRVRQPGRTKTFEVRLLK